MSESICVENNHKQAWAELGQGQPGWRLVGRIYGWNLVKIAIGVQSYWFTG